MSKPRVFIHGEEISLKRVHELAAKGGLLIAILKGQRCLTCLKKPALCECEKKESSNDDFSLTAIEEESKEVTLGYDYAKNQ